MADDRRHTDDDTDIPQNPPTAGAVEQHSHDDDGDDDDEWETESSDSEDESERQGQPPLQRPGIKDLLSVAERTNALLLSLMSDPRLNRLNPLASPVQLFYVCDFLRRTYLEYIIPLFPGDAPRQVLELANPFLFDYPDRSTGPFATGFVTDPSYLQDESRWPRWTPKRAERWSDSIGRNVLITEIMLQRDAKASMLMGGGSFDFQPDTWQLARGLVGNEHDEDGQLAAQYKERMRQVRRSVGLAG